jgi:hypothetical protein
MISTRENSCPIHPPELSGNSASSHLAAKMKELAKEINFVLRNISFILRNVP